MTYTIRNFEPRDFKMIESWWIDSKEQSPDLDLLPSDSTFILEMNNHPALCVSVYRTNSRKVALIECFVGNPKLKGQERKKGTVILFNFICSKMKDLGYKTVMVLHNSEKVINYYKTLGLEVKSSNVSLLSKQL